MKASLIGILEDVCKMEKNTGITYCERVNEKWKGAEDPNGPLFHALQGAAEAFTVVHFAGPVTYGTTIVDKKKFLPPSQWERASISPDCPTIDDFVNKNRDNIPQSLLDFFTAQSSNAYFKRIDKARQVREEEAERESAADSTPGRGGKKKKYVVHHYFQCGHRGARWLCLFV